MKIKNKYMLLIHEENFNDIVKKVLQDIDNDYILVLFFLGAQFKENYELILKLRKIFLADSEEYLLNNVIVISDVDYLPNDIGVKSTIVAENVYEFDYKNFFKVYSNSIDNFDCFYDFLESTADIFKYSFEYFLEEESWIHSYLGYGILTINEKTVFPILTKYHKVKILTPDIVFISLKGKEDDTKKLSLLKMIGSDALITFGITNIKTVEFSQEIDLILYNKSKLFENNTKQFLNLFLKHGKYENPFEELRKFLDIEEKCFDADLFLEKEEVEKPPKKCVLKVEKVPEDNIIGSKISKSELVFVHKKTDFKRECYILVKEEYE